MNEQQNLIPQFLATLAYRFHKAVRDAPPEFGNFDAGHEITVDKGFKKELFSAALKKSKKAKRFWANY